uniref:TIMELESS-interacting protein n=1 Tax=Scleropages formosus TaxID=113540 RepID=A0A8C9SKD4_SCLFO
MMTTSTFFFFFNRVINHCDHYYRVEMCCDLGFIVKESKKCAMIDPLENNLFDIPDYENTEDESFPPLPPPMSPHADDDSGDPFANGEDEREISKLAEDPVAKRRLVKRPQPKLDAQRLISERGLPALRTLFENVKFKGKGHEAEDLGMLMQKMENWAHRLYPKLQFDDFIDKVECLGSKKEVQTCLKRIRLDMPLTHQDFIGNDVDDGGILEDHTADAGIGEEAPIHSTPSAILLTEEQRHRIDLNKQLALERKLARQQELQTASQLCATDAGSAGEHSCLSVPSHTQDGRELDPTQQEEGFPIWPPPGAGR